MVKRNAREQTINEFRNRRTDYRFTAPLPNEKLIAFHYQERDLFRRAGAPESVVR
jgi:hypothetical protein